MSNVRSPIVCSFESRRAEEICSLITRHGGTAVSAPSMREVPLEENPVASRFIQDLIAGRYPYVVLMTGVGTEALLELARSQGLGDELVSALGQTTLMIRGPKPAAVLAKTGLKAAVRAPEPNTWRELLTAIEASGLPFHGCTIAVQEYGIPNERFCEGLRSLGAEVVAIPVYRWALPDDTSLLENALQQIVRDEIDVAMFTSANQLASVLTVAERLGIRESLHAALTSGRPLIASIGPTCSEALSDQGLPVHFEASPPKMGHLVRGAIDACTEVIR